ncbi:MAG: gluconokinase [Lentisphaeria bacterium]|jgi:gluconokinase
MVYVVMGVAGCGKTTVGQRLAARLGVPFHDGDGFHPPANVAKMKAGVPLDDADRAPWLALLAAKIAEWNQAGGAVLACSALKERYRAMLCGGQPGQVRFVYLKGSRDAIRRRMEERQGHFFPAALLESQFAALEEPRDAIVVDVAQELDEKIEAILRQAAAANG